MVTWAISYFFKSLTNIRNHNYRKKVTKYKKKKANSPSTHLILLLLENTCPCFYCFKMFFSWGKNIILAFTD